MKAKRFMWLVLTLLTLAAIGCATTVDIPPAHIGKIQTAEGLQDSVIPPSKIRLTNMCLACPTLVLAEASDQPMSEDMTIFMPQDQLNLTIQVRCTLTISNEAKNVDQIFARIPQVPTEDSRDSLIDFGVVYATYGRNLFIETVRGYLTQQTIEQVMNNQAAVSEALTILVRDALKQTPIQLKQFGFTNLQPPAIVVKAQEERKQREIAIERAKADKLVSLEQAEAAREVAIKQQEVDLIEAETQALVNERLAQAVSGPFVLQRYLQFLNKMAESDNAVFIPFEVLQNPGLDFRIFSKTVTDDLKERLEGPIAPPQGD